MREPWDESGIELEWNPPEVASEPLADWDINRFPRGSEILQSGKVAFLFGRREMPQEAIEPQKLEWICGSRDRLEQLVRWIAHSEAELWNGDSPVAFIFTCENQYVRAALGHCIRDGRGWETLPRLHKLCEIALDYNTPVGIGWEFCDGSSGKPPIRRSWDPCAPRVSIEVAPPTAHEQLEARLELRDWLEGKAPAQPIEAWLGPSL